jgi:hypothetical protein
METIFSNVMTEKAQKKNTTADQLDNRRFMSPGEIFARRVHARAGSTGFTTFYARITTTFSAVVGKSARRARAVPAGQSNLLAYVLKGPSWPRAGASDRAGGRPGVSLGHLSQPILGPFWPVLAVFGGMRGPDRVP